MLSLDDARRIAENFHIESPFEIEFFEGRGNINLDTLLISAGIEKRPYLLQRVNPDVFPLADRVMTGMIASIEAQKQAIHQGLGAETGWHVPELVPSKDGRLFHEDRGIWRMMQYIEGTVSYKSLSELPDHRRTEAAYEVGRGLAIYHDLTDSIDAGTVQTALPGYRNTRIYFDQLDCALEGCRQLEQVEHRLPSEPEVRAATEKHYMCSCYEAKRVERLNDPELQPFIQTALHNRDLALSLSHARDLGQIRTTAIHGDTKIENFLFDAVTGRVMSLVDLDTIMPLTWLADWGDMVRSLVNVAGEKERDLEKVQVDEDVYAAVLEGFLSTAATPTPEEIALIPRAVQVIALELGVRFLADYLRGDTYFKLGPGDPDDLNKVRAMVQIRLFERLVEHEPKAQAILEEYASRVPLI
ncbi:MAG TPA: phosphotransferase [Fimbriimonadaceae bacterium]|nr:phosphotransferase [Fimbriimonadaceae bacterium]